MSCVHATTYRRNTTAHVEVLHARALGPDSNGMRAEVVPGSATRCKVSGRWLCAAVWDSKNCVTYAQRELGMDSTDPSCMVAGGRSGLFGPSASLAPRIQRSPTGTGSSVGPAAYEENFRMIFELSDGTTLESRGEAEAEVIEAAPRDRVRLADEIAGDIERLGIADASVRATDSRSRIKPITHISSAQTMKFAVSGGVTLFTKR